MRKSLLLVIAIAIVSACDAGPNQPDVETTVSTTDSAELEAWRSCVIARVGRIQTATEEQLATLDKDIEAATQQLRESSEEISRLTSTIGAIQDIYDEGTRMLNEQGLPATIDQAREDPEIAAALDEGTTDGFSALSRTQLQTLNAVLERESSHTFRVTGLKSDKHKAEETNRQAHAQRRELESRRETLIAERESILAELNAALSTTTSSGLDWSLCTDSS